MMMDPLEVLKQKLVLIKDRVRGVLHGHANGVYLYGRPGTSKTHTVQTMLQELNVPHVPHNGHITPGGLFALLRDNPESIIVLDDVSCIFKEPLTLQYLLAALGTPPDGSRTRLVCQGTARGHQVARFSGGIIVITNLPLADHRSEVLAALKDRVHTVAYEPSDEEMAAFILEIASGSPRGVLKDNALMVAQFLLQECKTAGVRSSMRLFLDRALTDFQQWAAGRSQCHWQDLIRSSVQEEVTSPQHPLQDVSRKERLESERRLVLSICQEFPKAADRLKVWKEKTGGSKSPFYRHFQELKKQGLLDGGSGSVPDDAIITPPIPTSTRKRTGRPMGLILS